MAISPTAERMRIVLNLPALKRIMSISFRKARAHGYGARRFRGEGVLALTLFDESAERLTSKLCRFVKVIKSDRSCCHRKAKDLSLRLKRGDYYLSSPIYLQSFDNSGLTMNQNGSRTSVCNCRLPTANARKWAGIRAISAVLVVVTNLWEWP